MKNFWKFGSWLLVVLVMFLGGCAKPDSAVTKAYEIDMKTEDGSNIVILVLDADVESSTAVKQDARADARTQVDATLAPAGKVGEAAAVAEGLLEASKPAEKYEITPIVPAKSNPDPSNYEKKFHHTTTGTRDGGKSLVMCPGQIMNFDNCSCDGVDIPLHTPDAGRENYWNMKKVPTGDIICTKSGKTFKYKADAMLVFGECRS